MNIADQTEWPRRLSTEPKGGFTLIELLATIGILAILVAFLGQVFSQASLAWERGSQQVIRNADAKAVLDLIGRELEAAVVDEQLGILVDRDTLTAWPIDYSTVGFTTTSGAPNDSRKFEQVRYRVNHQVRTNLNYRTTRLFRRYRSLVSVDPKTNAFSGTWWDINQGWANEPVIEDIVRFDIFLYSGDESNFGADAKPVAGTEFNSVDRFRYSSESNRIPVYIDIYLQIASPDAMRRADALQAAGNNDEARELLDANSNVLFKRVYPRMRNAVL